MDAERLYTQVEIKAVDTAQRLIDGFAAAFSNKDRVGDIIDTGAFDRTLKENDDVLVFIGHDASRLPVGEPAQMRAETKGLFTQTRVYNTPGGDELLEVARQRMASGKTLGMSIGYRTVKQRNDGKARHLLDVDLIEYSFLASPALAANPEATVVGVKSADGTLKPVPDELQDQVRALIDEFKHAKPERKADVDVKDLPNDAFAFIETGGTLDEEKKTVPRAHRHYPHHAEDGALDLDAVKAALADPTLAKDSPVAYAHLIRHASAAIFHDKSVRDDAHDAVWSDLSAPSILLSITGKMVAIAEVIARDLAHQSGIDIDTKDNRRVRPDRLLELKAYVQQLNDVITAAEQIDRGEDGKARVDWLRAQFDVLQLEEVIARA